MAANIGIVEKKMEATRITGFRVYWDHGKENGNYKDYRV